MSENGNGNGNGRDEGDPGTAAGDDRRRGFHLEAGLRPLSDLLGSLIEVNLSDAPPPSGETVEWDDVDEATERREEPESQQKRTRRVYEHPSGACLIDTRLAGDEFVVTADIPGSTKDDISVGLAPGSSELVISRDGTIIGRVDIPWRSSEPTKVWFNNGVLEVHLRPKGT